MVAERFAALTCAAAGLLLAGASSHAQPGPDTSGEVTYVYTSFDADKTCRHRPSREPEDYGSWLCRGYGGIAVRLSAGDQRMQVSFGPRAAQELAAGQTFPGFNDVYKGTIEWRIAPGADGKPRPFATILRWNLIMEGDQGTPSGRALVVTRLGTGSVCHVGYVDARANPDANTLARKLADEKARTFKCGTDQPTWFGNGAPETK